MSQHWQFITIFWTPRCGFCFSHKLWRRNYFVPKWFIRLSSHGFFFKGIRSQGFVSWLENVSAWVVAVQSFGHILLNFNRSKSEAPCWVQWQLSGPWAIYLSLVCFSAGFFFWLLDVTWIWRSRLAYHSKWNRLLLWILPVQFVADIPDDMRPAQFPRRRMFIFFTWKSKIPADAAAQRRRPRRFPAYLCNEYRETAWIVSGK